MSLVFPLRLEDCTSRRYREPNRVGGFAVAEFPRASGSVLRADKKTEKKKEKGAKSRERAKGGKKEKRPKGDKKGAREKDRPAPPVLPDPSRGTVAVDRRQSFICPRTAANTFFVVQDY